MKWVWTGAAVVFFILGPVAWRIGNAFRKFARPDMFFARGALDIAQKKLFWMVGPQIVAMGALFWVIMMGVWVYSDNVPRHQVSTHDFTESRSGSEGKADSVPHPAPGPEATSASASEPKTEVESQPQDKQIAEHQPTSSEEENQTSKPDEVPDWIKYRRTR
jgi:hypothetical protein